MNRKWKEGRGLKSSEGGSECWKTCGKGENVMRGVWKNGSEGIVDENERENAKEKGEKFSSVIEETN